MVSNIIMPKLGLTTKKGTIIRWLKKEGDQVKEGEPQVIIETEKITTEVKAPSSGVLRKILSPEGAVVSVGEVIGIIIEANEELLEINSPKEVGELKDRILVSPLARKLAEKHNINVAEISGSGPMGRVVKEDILKAVQQVKAKPVATTLTTSNKTIPITATRKTIAERLSHSMQTTVHLTIMTEADATKIVEVRQTLLKYLDLSYNDILVKVVAKALERNRIINSMLDGEQIILNDEINIGVAVDSENGLVVPVVHNADKKSLTEIAASTKELIEIARNGTLSLKEVSGGTFTVTNLGVFGVQAFTPIINPPQSAILGVGRIVERPRIVEGQVAIRQVVNFSLTFDHMVMDGAQAARFLQDLKQILENPYLLLI